MEAKSITPKGHAYERVEDRMAEAGFNAETRAKVFAAAAMLASQSANRSEAIRLVTLPAMVGEAWSDRSNGNEVWAIVRGRRLVTVMLRRSTQPKTPEAFDVEAVTLIG